MVDAVAILHVTPSLYRIEDIDHLWRVPGFTTLLFLFFMEKWFYIWGGGRERDWMDGGEIQYSIFRTEVFIFLKFSFF